MIDADTEERASAYVLGVLDAQEAQAFEARLRTDLELRALISELRAVTAMLAGASPAVSPPAALREKVLANLDHSPDRRPAAFQAVMPQPVARRHSTWLPWALAAAFAIVCIALGWQSNGLHQQLAAQQRQVDRLNVLAAALRVESTDLRQTVGQLQQSNRIANLRIALLKSRVPAAPQALAVSVWNNARQTGVIVVRGLKPPPVNKDYQLWIIDPRYPTPVDAGVFRVDAAGNGRVDFKAKLPIQNANQFAVTEEMKGGAAVPTLKAMVLAGA